MAFFAESTVQESYQELDIVVNEYTDFDALALEACDTIQEMDNAIMAGIGRYELDMVREGVEVVYTEGMVDTIKSKVSKIWEFIKNWVKSVWNKFVAWVSSYVRGDKAFLSKKNKIKIITDGKEKFKLLFEDIKNAKQYIHIQYYILKKDGIGKQLFSLLEQKLKEGVQVYILYDDIGSRKLSISSLKNLTDNNAKIKSFFKSRFPLINFRMNYRNHRKLVIIDGDIGYTGGFNVGDEYLGLDKKFGYWRDTHLRIEGEAVGSLEYRFINDWNSQSSKKTEQLKLKSEHVSTPVDNYLPIQMVASGPDNKLQKIKYGYLHMISRAKKYIYIQSPYFIPDESVMDALKMAILSGIDVRIMVPNKPDHIFVYWATYSFIGELAQYGAQTYIYDNGFIHTKMIIIDDEVTSLGSANFDYRSFKLNFELNAFIYDTKTTAEFRQIFLKDIEKSTLVSYSKYQERSLLIKIKEAFARLISPIL